MTIGLLVGKSGRLADHADLMERADMINEYMCDTHMLGLNVYS